MIDNNQYVIVYNRLSVSVTAVYGVHVISVKPLPADFVFPHSQSVDSRSHQFCLFTVYLNINKTDDSVQLSTVSGSITIVLIANQGHHQTNGSSYVLISASLAIFQMSRRFNFKIYTFLKLFGI